MSSDAFMLSLFNSTVLVGPSLHPTTSYTSCFEILSSRVHVHHVMQLWLAGIIFHAVGALCSVGAQLVPPSFDCISLPLYIMCLVCIVLPALTLLICMLAVCCAMCACFSLQW